MNLGTIDTVRRAGGIGPDRTGPHGLLPPLQVETLAFTRPWEAGVQWLLDTGRIKQDAWVHWQRLTNSHRRERFDAGALGGEVGGNAGVLERLSLEAYRLGSRYDPDRADAAPARTGLATFLRVAAEKDRWRAHAILFRGDDFITSEGDPNYLSVRLDGTPYRSQRDDAGAGFTRVFTLAADSWLEASVRGHRVERHYEYSIRIFAVATLRID